MKIKLFTRIAVELNFGQMSLVLVTFMIVFAIIVYQLASFVLEMSSEHMAATFVVFTLGLAFIADRALKRLGGHDNIKYCRTCKRKYHTS